MQFRDEASRIEALRAEAIRLHLRYTVEVVERFNLCPWAKKAREDDEVRREVLLQDAFDPEPTLDLIARLEAGPRPTVAMAIYPRLGLPPRRFDELAARIKELDQKRHGGKPVYVSATFHPAYPLDTRSPSSIVPFLRRSPDPSLQLVQLGVLEAARGRGHGKFVFDYSAKGWEELLQRINAVSVPDRIAQDNRTTLEREGAATLEAIFADLVADRDRSYAQLGV